MPVSVSLESLVAVPGTWHLWPREFSDLVAAVHDQPDDRTRWGVVADWVEDHGEPEYAAAWRWGVGRPGVKLADNGRTAPKWVFAGLPAALTAEFVEEGKYSDRTAAGAVALLAERLRKLKECL